ncbi:hypothetical protein N7517_003920 [Penicillium concentricum]|uniref:Uncharacterized protein n=1 Tax=Penicillium concentricum TaxID=293559 RepID=A0A9W9S764_9EURO|nr:uncharacterized protein N7517_003920 [Penicillium concentricum]KAJ5371914.1 hypothetical protein N7517_003920 [Penicillium concentricum]
MHRYRDSLLSPSPKSISDLSNLDGRTESRADVRQSLARGEYNEVRGAAFFNRTWIISDRYCNVGDGVDSLEDYLREIWYMYFQLSVLTAHETPEHDRLVLDILRIQGKGPLTRPVRGLYGIDIARTVEGTLWNDLPFLVTDMTDLFINSWAPMSGPQRLNVVSFLAKLASTRICKDKMCQIALVLFRLTFESRQELRATGDLDNEDPRRSLCDLESMHLLPAANAWIQEAGYNLMLLSELSWNDCPSEIGRGGATFIDSDFGKRTPSGFTPWRWMYWLKRLHEIQEAAKQASEKIVEECASEAIERMVNEAEERNSEILRVFKDSGVVLYNDKHLFRLKELVENKDNKESETPDEDETTEEKESTEKTEIPEQKENCEKKETPAEEESTEENNKKN